MAETIERHGLVDIPREWAKPLEGTLWELRVIGKDGIARAICVTMAGQRLVIARICERKAQKTPRREIDLALSRAREVT
jgi:phage-related protein